MKTTLLLAAVAWTATLGAPVLRAQAPAQRTLWQGLYTEEQASRGNQVFSATCNNCHTLGDTGNRPLSGQKFMDKYNQRTVGDLFAYMSKNMPNGNGGSLAEGTYADLLALILKSNGVPAGTTDLVPTAVASIVISPKDGPAELAAGTLVRVVGCLTKGGADWVLTNATTPARTDKTGTAAEDAARPLGDRTIALKFVMTRLDANVGKRMSATGLLIGAGGADGLNVSTVTKVAETCP